MSTAFKRFFARPYGVGAPLNIHMFFPLRLLGHVATVIRRPRYALDRMLVMLFQLRHPDAPWLTAEAVSLLKERLRLDTSGFEWGSGASTLWFARRMGHLVSVEHVPAWHADVTRMLGAAGLTNVDYRLLATSGAPSPYVEAVAAFPDGHFDFILVDGEQRLACMAAAVPKLKRGGVLVLDNADQYGDIAGVAELRRRPTFNGVWRTDLYFRD